MEKAAIPTDKALELLAEHYPSAEVGLKYGNPWQLLVATILAAQANDRTINEITPVLFRRYPGPRELARAEAGEVREIILRSGTFRQKAARIIGAARAITEKHGGTVPQTMEKLLELPGVARKTANVILSNAFHRPQGIVVDTHVLRVCYRTGMSMQKDPVRMERELMAKVPREQWGVFENRIKLLGQQICQGRRPLHEKCFFKDLCPKHDYTKGPAERVTRRGRLPK